MPVLDWEGYVRLAFYEIRLAGAGSPQVARALRAALEDIQAVAPQERRAPLEREVELLDRAVQRAYEDDADRSAALVADTLGIGSGSDVVRHDGAESHTPIPRDRHPAQPAGPAGLRLPLWTRSSTAALHGKWHYQRAPQ